MKHFANLVLWFLRWDLEFARATGRGPQSIAALNSCIREWELIHWNAEHKLNLPPCV